MAQEAHDDFETEALPGLPEPLPEGETLLWQGQPDVWRLAVRAFHVRKVALYFLLLAGWDVVSGLHDGMPVAVLLTGLGKLSIAAGFALGLLLMLARASARETIYSLTDQRLVMRFGVALRLTINLPYSQIEGASLQDHGDNHGDIALVLEENTRISYAVLWPHARAWQLRRAQPTLRCIPNAASVARLMSSGLSSAVANRPAVSGPELSPTTGPVLT